MLQPIKQAQAQESSRPRQSSQASQPTQPSQANQSNITPRAYRRGRRCALILCLFVGVGALYGGVGAFIVPEFFGASLIIPFLRNIPFVGGFIDSYTLPASALLIFIFVPQTTAAALLLWKRSGQFTAVLICGILMSLFTIGELIFIPNPVSVLFLLFGISEIVAALACSKAKSEMARK